MPTRTQMFLLLLTLTTFSILSGAVFRDIINESREITYEEYRHVETLVEKYKDRQFIVDFNKTRGGYITRREYNSVLDCANRVQEIDSLNKLRGTNIENEITASGLQKPWFLIFAGVIVITILFIVTWTGIDYLIDATDMG